MQGLKRKKKKSSFTTLFDAHWRRVILDEAHVIRNHKTGVSMGACALSAGQWSCNVHEGAYGLNHNTNPRT